MNFIVILLEIQLREGPHICRIRNLPIGLVVVPGKRPIVDEPSVPEDDNEFTPDTYDNAYLNMELSITRDSNGPEFVWVTRRLIDKDGLMIEKSVIIPSWTHACMV